MAPGPIDYVQIEAWARLRRIVLKDWEITALRMMDDARLEKFHEEHEDKKDDKPGKPVISSQPLTPALFDRIMDGLADGRPKL